MLTETAGCSESTLRAGDSDGATVEADDERMVAGLLSGSDEVEWPEWGEVESVEPWDVCRWCCAAFTADDGDVGAERMPTGPAAAVEVEAAELADSGGASTARYGCFCWLDALLAVFNCEAALLLPGVWLVSAGEGQEARVELVAG